MGSRSARSRLGPVTEPTEAVSDEEAFLVVAGLTKSFGEQQVLRGIDLEVGAGEVLALLGPSGSGKSTLLRAIGGFEPADNGTVHLQGRDITNMPPRRRPLGMVFQSYALFPHLSVEDNIAFGLHGQPAAMRRERVDELLRLVRLEGLGARAVDQISGGQQQRVALARAMAPNPSMLLLDEPLSNLDPSLREATRDQLLAIIHRVGITTILVTHEQEEAFALGDRVAVLHGGRLEQVGGPVDLYRRPSTAFVAGFIGRANWFEASCVLDGERVRVEVDGWSAPLHLHRNQVAASCVEKSSGSLWVRPESLHLVEDAEGPSWAGTVVRSRWVGPHALVVLENEQGEQVEVASRSVHEAGASAMVELGDEAAVRIMEPDPAA